MSPAIQNIILACRALGLGTLITTNHTIAEEEIKQVLNLPSEFRTFALMPIGYPDRSFGPVKRRPVAEVAMLTATDLRFVRTTNAATPIGEQRCLWAAANSPLRTAF